MLRKFLRTKAPSARAPAAIPEGLRVYAIGDIHGRLDLLDDLIAAIDADDDARGDADTTLVFLGDLVDRGPDSAGVVDRVLGLAASRPGVRMIMGNHEEVFLGALDEDAKALKMFCRIGGRETAISYGIDPGEYERLDYPQLAARLIGCVPDAHRTFLAAGEDVITIGDYAFVHAGIRPGVALDEQRTIDLRWIRETFLDHDRPFDRMIVHGHTMTEDVETRVHRIGIDTGAYATGRLTALGIEGDRTWQLQTGGSAAVR